MRTNQRKKNRERAASRIASELIAQAGAVRAEVRGRFLRPAEETPNADVLLKVGGVLRLCALTDEVATKHRKVVAEAAEAAVKRRDMQADIDRLQRQLAAATRRADTAEAALRREGFRP